MLDDAVTNRRSPFRIPLFVCGDQSDFDGRIAVLRKSAKLKNNKNASMLFYDKEKKIQVRLKVECAVNHNNEITKESWSKTGHISRKCYLVDNGSGTEFPSPTSGLRSELDNNKEYWLVP
jgi:3-hydroxyisobutyrate dehydrogenase